MPKKLIAIALVLAASFLIAAPNAKALTIEELQAQIDALLAQIQLLQQQLVQTGGGTGAVSCSITSFTRNLSQGATGDDVKCLQIVLNSSADTQVAQSGSGAPGSETTYFGALTKAAVVKFQDKNASEILTPLGLTSGTGFVGAATRAKLNTMIGTTGTGGTGGTGGTVITGPGLTVAFASDNPAAGTIVADSASADGAQALVPMLKIKFSNGDTAERKVTQIKFKRTGISADTDISQAYLYYGDVKLAEYNSFSSGVLTFSNSSGLFTIPAGSSKDITLRIDLTNGTTAGKTLGFSLLLATDITSDAVSVAGTFPLTGSFMTTAAASDLGKLTIATTSAAGATVDPQDGLEIYNFTLQGQDQKLQIKRITFTNMGSVAASDLKNFKLYDGGTQLLTTIAEMASDKTIAFDFGSAPFEINKGITKQMHLKADIVGGTNRNFQFSIVYQTDVMAYDTEYGVYIKPNANAWTSQSTLASTINTGRLVIGRKSDSPSGNVAKDGTNLTLASFDLKAIGEDVKIASLVLDVSGSIGDSNGLYQTKILFDGSQKGSTANANTGLTVDKNGSTTYSFSNTFIVPADGTNHKLEVVSDIKTSTGGALTGGETLTAKIKSVSATGRISLAAVSTVSSAGNQLTVASGNFTLAKNLAIPDWSAIVPTGVPGQTEALIGAFVVTAGASEGVDVTSIKIKDDGVEGFPNLQNLKIYKGTKTSGTQIGTTQSNLTTGTSYTFYPSPYISLNASQQLLLYAYADLKTATSTGDGGYLQIDQVDGVGKTTNSSFSGATDTVGQAHNIALSGALVFAAGDDRPVAANVNAGATGVIFNQFKFTAGAAEDMLITKFVLNANFGSSTRGSVNPVSSLANITIYDGSTPVSSMPSVDANNRAVFTLTSSPWKIPAGTTKVLTAKADISLIPYCTSSGWSSLNVTSTSALDGWTSKGAISGTEATNSDTGNVAGYPMYNYMSTPKVYVDANTPSGQKLESTALELLHFWVENIGLETIYFDKLASVTIAYTNGTGYATTQAGRVFRLYDAADLSTWLASTTLATSSDVGAVINGAELKFDLSPDKAIAGNGGKKKFIIKGDITDAGATAGSNIGSVLQLSMDSGTDFVWNDNVAASVSSTLVKTFPIDGGTITF